MNNQQITNQAHILAIITYATFVGLIVVFFLNREKKNPFVLFHLRQMFGLVIMLFIANSFFEINRTLYEILSIPVFLAWLYGLSGAIFKKYRSVPLLGEKFQQWFKFIN